jgi:hypothetical protein
MRVSDSSSSSVARVVNATAVYNKGQLGGLEPELEGNCFILDDAAFQTRNRARCTLSVMRRTVAVETGLALLLAFFFAPFQHVHADHSGVVHSHFLNPHGPHAGSHSGGGIEIEDDDDDDHAHASSIDTFTIVLPDGLRLSVPAQAPIAQDTLLESFVPVAVVEQRTHDPPPIDRSTPRAPPL